MRDRCLRKDPDLKLDDDFRMINKENLDIARAKLPTILKNVKVVGTGASAGGGQSSLGAIGGAHLAASDHFRIQQNNAARVMSDTNVHQFLGAQQALQNGGARVVQPGGGRQPPPSATTEAVETCSGFAFGRAEARRCKDGKAFEQQEDEE